MKSLFDMKPSFLLISYCILAILITISNKYLLTFGPSKNGNVCRSTFFILFIQSVISIILLHVAKFYSFLTYRSFNYRYLKSWVPIITFLILSIYSNGKSLQLLPISLFNILKNFGSVLIIVGDVAYFGRSVYTSTLVAFGSIILSNIYSSYNDIILNTGGLESYEGYAWAILNCCSCAVYTLYVKYHRENYKGITNIEYVYYNNLLTTPILLCLSLYFEGIQCIRTIIQFNSNNLYFFIATLLFSSALTLLISIVIANIYKVVSPTTYTLTGSLNKIFVTLVSVSLFLDEKELYELHFSAIFGLLLSLLTGIYLIIYA